MIFSLLSLFLLQCPSKTSEGIYEKHVYESSDGHELPYRILYPEKYSKSKSYPVLLFLHGAGERGNDNESQLAHISGKFQTDQFRHDYPAIVIFPQCAEDDSWAYVERDNGKWLVKDTDEVTPSMYAVIELMDQLMKELPIDRSRIYLTGLSMGGFGTFALLAQRPDWFAAAVPICGGGNKRYSYKYKDIPVWIFHGAKDPVVPVELSRELAEDFKGRKMNVRYTEYPEGGHDVWNRAWDEPALLPWLFSKVKQTKE